MKKKNQDPNNILKQVDEKIENLAITVSRGFEQIDKRFEHVDERFDGLEKRINQKIDGLGNRVDDLALNRATREEMRLLDMRVSKIEQKLQIK